MGCKKGVFGHKNSKSTGKLRIFYFFSGHPVDGSVNCRVRISGKSVFELKAE
jgi:hypothetical protein